MEEKWVVFYTRRPQYTWAFLSNHFMSLHDSLEEAEEKFKELTDSSELYQEITIGRVSIIKRSSDELIDVESHGKQERYSAHKRLR